MSRLIDNAIIYAMKAHDGQFRDDGQTPYVTHLQRVTSVLRQVTTDPELIAAGWLHDTIEDTDTTYEELTLEFGPRVAGLVLEVTHNDDLSYPNLHSRDGILLKFADRLSNLSDMNEWDAKKQQWYLNKSVFWKK